MDKRDWDDFWKGIKKRDRVKITSFVLFLICVFFGLVLKSALEELMPDVLRSVFGRSSPPRASTFEGAFAEVYSQKETVPSCFVAAKELPGGIYKLSWRTISASNVDVYLDETAVSKDGDASYEFDGDEKIREFFLVAKNRFGDCHDSVKIERKLSSDDLSCNLHAPIHASSGEVYKLSWVVKVPHDERLLNASINGTNVLAQDSANYTFDSSSWERFVLRAETATENCVDSAVVLRADSTDQGSVARE